MIVPKYWAEVRLRQRVNGRSILIRRFGWSDTSQEHAEAVARTRAAEALDRIRRGEPVKQSEPRMAYCAGEGVPIREEIVQTVGQSVITRNCYGALCLNTPNVLFADIDFITPLPVRWFVLSTMFCAVASFFIWRHTNDAKFAAGMFVILSMGGLIITAIIFYALMRWLSLVERNAIGRVIGFVRRRPNWHIRLYRTAAGLRVLAMHQTFDPHDLEVKEFFECIRADPNYVRMCRMQRCFRARLTPKPWRVGISEHIRPRHGVAWPVDPRYVSVRMAWVEHYERACTGYAVCNLIEEIGSRVAHPAALEISQLHDAFCRVGEPLPLA